jgi:predicted enzyme related to lactoylglutathione lyase
LLTADVTRTKTPIGSNMGNRGVMRDTEGNVIGVFESAQASKET